MQTIFILQTTSAILVYKVYIPAICKMTQGARSPGIREFLLVKAFREICSLIRQRMERCFVVATLLIGKEGRHGGLSGNSPDSARWNNSLLTSSSSFRSRFVRPDGTEVNMPQRSTRLLRSTNASLSTELILIALYAFHDSTFYVRAKPEVSFPGRVVYIPRVFHRPGGKKISDFINILHGKYFFYSRHRCLGIVKSVEIQLRPEREEAHEYRSTN